MNDFTDDVQRKADDAGDWVKEKADNAGDWVEEKKDDFNEKKAYEDGKTEGWAEAKKAELEEDIDARTDNENDGIL